jgi:HK97 family phage portal protein
MGVVLDALATLPITRAPKTSPARMDQPTAVAITRAYDGKVGVANPKLYRHWYRTSEWVRGAVDIRTSQVSSAEWDIVPFDQRRPYSKRLAQDIKQLLQTPNPSNDSYRSFIEPVVRDLLILDAGVVEKVRNLYGDLTELWPVNGAQIKLDSLWDGDEDQIRYYWMPDGWRVLATFKNDDMLYMMANRRTDSPVGLPPMETLRLTIEAELAAHEYNRRQVTAAAPDGLLDLGEGIAREQVRSFRSYFESEVAGKGAIGFIGGGRGAKWIPFRDNNRNMQFLEWQIYLVRKIAVVFGLTPQDLGVTFDVNRSTSEVQIQISEDRGLRPLMSLIQEYLTEEIVWDASFGGEDNNLAFRFTALNLKESTAKANINELALAHLPWRFINEARIGEGREPIAELEGKMIVMTPQGALDISDVPTVREFLEMQSGGNQPAPSTPPSSSTKSDDLDIIINRLEPLLLAASNRAPSIESGAISVKVDSPVTVDQPSELTRETSYQFDERGLITGKIERTVRSDGSASLRGVQFALDDAGRIVGKVEKEVAGVGEQGEP